MASSASNVVEDTDGPSSQNPSNLVQSEAAVEERAEVDLEQFSQSTVLSADSVTDGEGPHLLSSACDTRGEFDDLTRLPRKRARGLKRVLSEDLSYTEEGDLSSIPPLFTSERDTTVRREEPPFVSLSKRTKVEQPLVTNS